ncbi:hypothetical protein M758_3G249400 [Ceratodon purpureus]|nr:hypothetical protein M758_3G249400 [Ceratodon purpureus]
MDMAMCERHSGAQPGGGICATCLQEKLMLLWRGEGNSNWDTEEFSVTPPVVYDSSKSPPVCEPQPAESVTAPNAYRAASACFPLLFRARNLQRDDVHESSKSSKGLEREKIDRSCSVLDGDHQHQFSCEIKSIIKELTALHEKKKLEKAVKKRRPSTESGCLSARHQQHEGVAVDVSQGPISASPGTRDIDAAPVDPNVPKATGSIHEEDVDENAKDTKAILCFNALWPAKLNMKWVKFLVSPIVSSNKIAPSKSDLLSKIVNARPKGLVEEAREDIGRECETSGMVQVNNDVFDRTQIMPSPALALLPPRYVQRAADEDGAVLEIDKETAMRMEASRITVMTWLQSLPSPKAVHLKGENHSGLLDDLALGHGMLEMCDEEEVEFDCQSQEMDMNNAKFDSADGSKLTNPLEQVDLYSHMNSFGKFLRTPSHICAPTRMVDIEITAQ